MNKYKHKIPKDDLKRFAKDVAKKLVSSDYKAGRVENPTKISEKQQKKVKHYCKDYFDKAALKHKKMEEDKAAKTKTNKAKVGSSHATPAESPKPSLSLAETPKKEEEDEDIKMSDIDDEPLSPSESMKNGSGTLKRKRSTDLDAVAVNAIKEEDADDLTKSPMKKANITIDRSFSTPPPPPPPAPPAETPSEQNSPDGHVHSHGEEAQEQEPDVHADTNFRDKSMADVRALAQMDAEDEDEVDWGMDEDVAENGVKVEDPNPLVEEQPV